MTSFSVSLFVFFIFEITDPQIKDAPIEDSLFCSVGSRTSRRRLAALFSARSEVIAAFETDISAVCAHPMIVKSIEGLIKSKSTPAENISKELIQPSDNKKAINPSGEPSGEPPHGSTPKTTVPIVVTVNKVQEDDTRSLLDDIDQTQDDPKILVHFCC